MIFDSNSFGRQVRTLRKQQGWTLRDLAKITQRSVSLLSQVENGKINPSFNTMQTIADALEVSLAQIIADQSAVEESDYSLVRASERRVLVTSGGVQHQFLSRGLSTGFKFIIVEVPPGTSTSKTLYAHEGVECGFLLEGELMVEIDDHPHHLKPGDSITFKSIIPHKLSNPGTEKAVAVWVNSVPSHTPIQPGTSRSKL